MRGGRIALRWLGSGSACSSATRRGSLGSTVPGSGRLEVLEVSRHRNKLRLGHLRGNRFRLGLEGADEPGAADALRAALERLSLTVSPTGSASSASARAV